MRDSTYLEDWLKEMVSDAAMNPSDKVWHGIRKKTYSGRAALYKVFVLAIFVFLFSVSWITIGSFKPLTLPLQTNLLNKDASVSLIRINENAVQEKIQSDQACCQNETRSNALQVSSVVASTPFISYNHARSSIQESPLKLAPVSIISPMSSYSQPGIPDMLSSTVSASLMPGKIESGNKPMAFQFYVTPSVSYRIMNSQYVLKAGESLSDRKNHVRHYPAMGIEAGIGLIKPLTARLSIKGGLQVNFSRYQIKGSETDQMLVFVSTSPISGFEESSRMSNSDGNKPKRLMNENFQLSVPIGLDYEVYKNKRISLGAAGSIQPGFTIHASGHLITTNYKNYIQAAHLFRRFNMQSALESYIKIHAGSIDIHAGPQIRYQLLSNTVDIYPIKEHLIDYGFKIGVIKHIR